MFIQPTIQQGASSFIQLYRLINVDKSRRLRWDIHRVRREKEGMHTEY